METGLYAVTLGCVSFTSPITFEVVGQFHPNPSQI